MFNLIKESWAIFWSNKRPFIWAALVYLAAQALFVSLGRSSAFLHPSLVAVAMIADWLVVSILAAGFITISLKAVSGQMVLVTDLLRLRTKDLLYLICLNFLFLVALSLPMMAVMFILFSLQTSGLGYLFLAFGLFIAVSLLISLLLFTFFGLSYFIIFDKQLNPIKALINSWTITKGDHWLMIKTIVVVFGLLLVGKVTIIGSLVTLPLAFIFLALVYRQITTKELPMI